MRRPGPSTQYHGSRIGPRIATLVSKAMGEHLQRTGGTRAKLAAEGANEFFRGMSREKRQHISPLTALFMGNSETTPEMEKLLHFIVHGQGEASEILNMLGVGGAVSSSITAAIANYLAPANQDAIRQRPNGLLDPATSAAAAVAGFWNKNRGEDEANRGGVNNERFEVLEKMSYNWPSLSEVLELWRRGQITEGAARGMLLIQRIHPEQITQLLTLKREHLAPADAALAVLRGIIPEGEGAEIAAVSGYTAADFNTLVLNTGEPPGLMQLLEAYRRGFIDDSRLNRGIRQSRIRDEWHDVVEKLRFEPASTADAIQAVIQGHLGEPQAKRIAEWNGQRPEDFQFLVEIAGNPMSNMQALELLNRGVVDESRVREAIREGRTKDKYIDNIMHLRVKLPPVFQTIKMISTGGVSAARGAEIMHAEGYEPDVVTGLVHAATSEQATKAKAVGITQVEELYEELALTQAEAITHLGVLGISHANALLILKVADIKRERKLIDAAITPIRSKYIARHIDESEASNLLDKIHLPSSQRDLLLDYWAVDRAAQTKTLTEAQIIAANKLGLIPDADAEKRLISLGYNLEDARILLDSEKGRAHPAP